MNTLASLATARAQRQDLVGRMAARIIELNATDSESAAIRALMDRFGYGDIVALASDALIEAQRMLVAANIS
jgi:hypothetical protein